jgi:hypothetical protein
VPPRRAAAAAAALSEALAVPPPISDGDDSPGSPRWRDQSLSKGAAGVAVLHGTRARDGASGAAPPVHAWLARATREDLSAGHGAGLWFGAPAVAFAVTTAAPGRYPRAKACLDAGVAQLTQTRLQTAATRMAAAARPAPSEFDLVRGLTGLGAYLLRRELHSDLVRRVLTYLVQLTEPVPASDDVGRNAPGWWATDASAGAA